METITNIVPIRIDASSEGGTKFRIVDTLLIDTTCLPVSHVAPSTKDESKADAALEFSLISLIERNASYLAESILADAEVYGAVRTSKHYLGGRLDLLSDTQLYNTIYNQIYIQLSIALNVGKKELLCNRNQREATAKLSAEMTCKTESSDVVPDNMQSTAAGVTKEMGLRSNIIRIKLRLRHENIVVVDEFDYDVNLSGLEGSDPFSIAKCTTKDLNLPPEFEVSIACSMMEQIYGIDVPQCLDGVGAGVSCDIPGAYVLNIAQEGSSAGIAQMILDT